MYDSFLPCIHKLATTYFPGLFGFESNQDNDWGILDGTRTYLGRTTTLVIVEGVVSATIFAPTRELISRLPPTATISWAGEDEAYAIFPGWSGLPKAKDFPDSGHSMSGAAWHRAIAHFLLNAVSAQVNPRLIAKKVDVDGLTDALASAIPEAVALLDYFGESLRMQVLKDVPPSTQWRWGNCSSSMAQSGWGEDRAPVDGELVYVLRDLGVRVARVAHRPRYSSENRWYFILVDLGPVRFSAKGILTLPEKDAKNYTSRSFEGHVLARTEATDLLARGMSTALHRLATERDRKAAINSAFGDNLKSLVEMAVATATAAATKAAAATEES